MGHNRRRRPTGARRATFGAFALILGGGGLVAVNVIASATESSNAAVPLGSSGIAATVDCPDLSERLTTVPDGARADVDTELARMDEQIATAYRQLQEAARTADDGTLDEAALLGPLNKERAAGIERITAAMEGAGERPEGLEALAQCALLRTEVTPAASEGADGGQDGAGAGENAPQEPGNGGQAGNGPVAADFADIMSVEPAAEPAQGKKASRGTFSSSCGVNAEGLYNSDNIIVAPGVGNGAHHFHDYIGNQANNAFASDDDLAAAATSCADQGDKSSYYWPVLRLQNGTTEKDAESPGGGIEGNAGQILTAKEVTLTFVGNERGKVTEMPKLLRIITGDAKAFVNGVANANASWSCTGLEDRQLKDKYPLCPQGSDVVRTFTFQSCWDGRNIDSANHRTHVAFPGADGTCPDGFQPIPRLVQRIVYDVDAPSLADGGKTTPLFAVDSFPEQLHKPVTDHGDFINLFDEGLMREVADCINTGRTCGADAPPAEEPGQGEEPKEQPKEQPGATQPPADGGKDGGGKDGGKDGKDADGKDGGKDQGGKDDAGKDGKDQGGDATAAPSDAASAPAGQDGNGKDGDGKEAAPADRDGAAASPDAEPRAATTAPDTTGDVGSAVATPEAGQTTPGGIAGAAPQAQGVQGDLAETGAGLGLWPAVAGGVLFAAGCVLLIRTRRQTA
ncbi:DUF1996 domain-containing protein [Streptomyces tagetis]|uniref:DUF1996 domain-containing protein n=1 Tax=Streptomyces tagetis TaxID=2820809 RepID=A0A940XDR3_9ACTN|nr:DUF1996 domain-containing protein [Streptomyces sp. RG38]MBQ0826351.1 DUF1996 domain-containing protein [Streptomyces sp. RG38]